MATCNHEWYVFSTAINIVELMVECRKCGAFGTVAHPTSEEWSDAWSAPSNPYLWTQPERVKIRQGVIWER